MKRGRPEFEHTTSVTIVRRLLDAAAREGVDVAAVLHAANIAPEALAVPYGRIGMMGARRVLRDIFQRCGSEFVFTTIEHQEVGAFDLLDYLMRSSATLGEALERVVRYQRLMCDEDGLAMHQTGRYAYVVRRAGSSLPELTDLLLALIVIRARRFTGGAFALDRVRLAHKPAASRASYKRVFQAPVVFEQPVNALVFPCALLSIPLLSAEPGLNHVLALHAEQVLRDLPAPVSLLREVRAALEQLLPTGDASIEAVSERLKIGKRSLQRRLREFGASHREMLEELRCQLAHRRLQSGRVTQQAIADELGYATLSSFQRAYKRWSIGAPIELP